MNNDLISRSELKKAFEHLASDDYENPLWYEDTVFRVIDNAPTVDVGIEIAQEREKLYEESKKLYILAKTLGKEERPQGEWHIDKSGVRWCKFCGASEISAWANFCHNCGAKMVLSEKTQEV